MPSQLGPVMSWLSALGDLFSIGAFFLGLHALRQWRIIRKADAVEAGMSQLDELRGAFYFVRNRIFVPDQTWGDTDERRKQISAILVERWRDRNEAIVKQTFKVGRLCQMRLGRDGMIAYELFQRLRQHCNDASNAAFALGLNGTLEGEEVLWRDALHNKLNDPLQVKFDQDAQELKLLLERFLPTLKRQRV
jgi:hypothetical protein